MKIHLNKYIMSIVGGAALLLSACSDGDTVFDDIIDNETRGAVLRTIEVISNEISVNSSDGSLEGGSFEVVLEEQDQEGGDLLAFVEVYASFLDNTDEGGDNTRDEVLVTEIDASEFTIGEFGYPRTQYAITAEELLSVLGLSSTQIAGGDQFRVRFELVLTDGRRYSFADNTGTLTGSFYSSPFLYSANVVCAPSAPTAGTWTFIVTDSYGDGWNGGYLAVVIDGGDVIEVTNTDSGGPYPVETTQTVEVEVPAGSETISIQYVGGSFDSEVTFEVISANGNTVITDGPDPTTGAELLDYCPDNL